MLSDLTQLLPSYCEGLTKPKFWPDSSLNITLNISQNCYFGSWWQKILHCFTLSRICIITWNMWFDTNNRFFCNISAVSEWKFIKTAREIHLDWFIHTEMHGYPVLTFILLTYHKIKHLYYTLTLKRNTYKLFLIPCNHRLIQILILCQGVQRDSVWAKMATEID